MSNDGNPNVFDGGVENRRHAKTGNKSGAVPEAEQSSSATSFVRVSGPEDKTLKPRAGVASGPSDTRPADVTVEAKHLVSSARAFLAHFDPCDLAEDKSQQWQSLEHQCNRVERALLDNPQFEIRRK